MNSTSIDPSNPFHRFGVSNICAICTKQLLHTRSYFLETIVDQTVNVNLYHVLESQFQFKCVENGPSKLCALCFSKTILFYEFDKQCKQSIILFGKYIEWQQQFTTGEDINLGKSDKNVNTTNVDEEPDIQLSIKVEDTCITESTLVKTKDDSNILDAVKPVAVKPLSKPRFRKRDRQTLRANVLKQKSMPQQVYKCTVCDAVYTNHKTFGNHQRTHNLKYVCSFCGKSLGCKSILMRHERRHTDERPFSCGKCSKAFKTKYNLIDHQRIHGKERPYKCEHCHKAFKTRANLHHHKLVHTLIRPYECSVCNRRFKLAFTLKTHMQVHEGAITDKVENS